MGPLLAGLDAAHYEARRNQSTIGLHAFYQAKELLHLLHISTTRFLRPAPLALRDVVDITTDGMLALLHVEPPGVPPLQRSI